MHLRVFRWVHVWSVRVSTLQRSIPTCSLVDPHVALRPFISPFPVLKLFLWSVVGRLKVRPGLFSIFIGVKGYPSPSHVLSLSYPTCFQALALLMKRETSFRSFIHLRESSHTLNWIPNSCTCFGRYTYVCFNRFLLDLSAFRRCYGIFQLVVSLILTSRFVLSFLRSPTIYLKYNWCTSLANLNFIARKKKYSFHEE